MSFVYTNRGPWCSVMLACILFKTLVCMSKQSLCRLVIPNNVENEKVEKNIFQQRSHCLRLLKTSAGNDIFIFYMIIHDKFCLEVSLNPHILSFLLKLTLFDVSCQTFFNCDSKRAKLLKLNMCMKYGKSKCIEIYIYKVFSL